MDLSAPDTTIRPTPIPAVLRTAVRGSVFFPTDPDWHQALLTWDLPVDLPLHALVVAEGAADVEATMAYATHHGLRVAAHGAPASADLADTILLLRLAAAVVPSQGEVRGRDPVRPPRGSEAGRRAPSPAAARPPT